MSGALRIARCHCGAVELQLRPAEALADIRRCTCSFCIRRGAPAISAALDDLEVVRGAEHLTLYTWGTGTARHYFCAICGIYTHHQRRSDPTQYGVNAACIEGVEIDRLDIPWSDGRNHPSDA